MTAAVDEKIKQHFSKYPKRVYPKGQILVFADENPDHIYYLVKGQVRQYDVSYRGDEVIVNIYKPPAFFPMTWAVNHTPNSYFYKTETQTELHAIPADDTLQFVKDNPDVMLDLLSRVYRGMEGLMGRMVHLMAGTAKSRLLYELVIGCYRFGAKGDGGSCELEVSEVDLAARSGLSRETVSREMGKMKTEGLVEMHGKSIVVKDVGVLEKKLGMSA